jgi:hypothetical protein
MILPPPAAIIAGIACLQTRNDPVTLISMARRHSASSNSARGFGAVIAAALLETTCRPPKAWTVAAIASATEAQSFTSQSIASARPFDASMCAATPPAPSALDVGASDTGALGREALGDGLADPLGRSGDERDLALQLSHCNLRTASMY